MKFERPLQERELNILELQLARLDRKRRYGIRFLVVWTFLALVVGSIAYFREPKDGNGLLLIMAIYIGIGVWVVVEQRVKGNRRRKSIAYLKEKNLVTVVEVNSDTFYMLEEVDDEGVLYLFQLEGNRVLSFGGQDFFESDNFPSDKFEIVEGRGIGDEILILEAFVQGKKIKPKKVFSSKEKVELVNNSNYPDPEKLTIVEGRIEDYVSGLVILPNKILSK